MPRSLATGHRRVAILTTKPADMKAPTVTELDAGLHASCRIVAANYTLGPGDSETISEGSLCDEVVPEVPTNATFEKGELGVFRYWDAAKPGTHEVTGAGSGDDAIGDAVFQALKARGTTLWIVDRLTGKKATDPWEAGDEVRVFEVITDAPREGEMEGYIKALVPLFIQGGTELDALVAA